MWKLKQTTQFKRDFKKYCRDRARMELLRDVLGQLREKGTVGAEYNPHPLKGKHRGHMECHVQNNFLLIWFDEIRQTIKLVRMGTHSELFGK